MTGGGAQGASPWFVPGTHSTPMARSPRPFLLAALVSISACAGGVRVSPGAPESAVTPTAIVSHPAYQAAFEALRATLDDGDLQAARATSRRLRARLERERATLPSMEAARKNEGGPLSYQVLSGELPAKESAEGALRMVDGFDSVIEGRARVRALDLAVILSRVPDSEQVRVVLRARSAWPEPLELRPGAGTVQVLRTSLEPRAGDERRDSARIALPEATVLRVPANAEADLELCRLAIEMPLGAIATRMRVDTVFLGGTIQEGDQSYPAQDFDVRSARRTDLAGKIPAVAVGPGPLLELVERGRAPLAAILERTVVIPPARFPETLDRLGESLEIRPLEAIRPVIPSLRWLAETETFGRDEKASARVAPPPPRGAAPRRHAGARLSGRAAPGPDPDLGLFTQ